MLTAGTMVTRITVTKLFSNVSGLAAAAIIYDQKEIKVKATRSYAYYRGKFSLYTSYTCTMLSSGKPQNISQVTCIFPVYTQAFR